MKSTGLQMRGLIYLVVMQAIYALIKKTFGTINDGIQSTMALKTNLNQPTELYSSNYLGDVISF